MISLLNFLDLQLDRDGIAAPELTRTDERICGPWRF
jgi:hypothetical protein